MPKRPAGLREGRMPWRDRFVARMSELQDARGWSDAGMAERVSRHYPMSAATIWKLKNAEPARGVTLDEALAIVSAFEFTGLEQFLATTTSAGIARDRLAAANERVIVYRQSFPTTDLLRDLRAASDALVSPDLYLKERETANLEAVSVRFRREVAELVEVVSAQAKKLGHAADEFDAQVQARKGQGR